MTRKINEEEWGEVLESLLMLLQRAHDEVALMEAHGEKASVIALQLGSTLQSAVEFASMRFPSEWRIQQ